MHTDFFADNWPQIRGRVPAWWGNLTADDLDRVDGKRDRLVALVQQKYGYTTARAARELEQHLDQMGRHEPAHGAQTSTLTHARVMAVGTLTGYRVVNPAGDDLGQIEDIAIDMESGRIAYAVLSFGGFLGIGDKFFAIPWEALRPSSVEGAFILHVDREALANAPGFDKAHWPEMADRQWGAGIYDYYGYRPYWEE
jgi:uncharacterized protein YjbJ (UPF0337 family)/sporulation protein YlmC with PRC-barrel domain